MGTKHEVVVEGPAQGLAQRVTSGKHSLSSDEPTSAGGTDSGPGPYELLLAALGSCTSMTLSMYAKRKQWPLERVKVRLEHQKAHVDDCKHCDSPTALLDHIVREIELTGPLNAEQKARLLEIAEKCPVHRTLTSEIRISTRLAG